MFWGSRKGLDGEIDEELRFHIEARIERYIRAGLTPEQARRKALERFGNIQQVREAIREIELGTIESICQDLRYGVRTLANSPGFTAVAVLSLALGIGLNSAMFSAVNAVLLRPLPYQDPERIVVIGQISRRFPTKPSISPANYLDWQEQNTVFETMAAIAPFDFGNYGRVSLGRNRPVAIQGLCVTASFFDVLGIQPVLGRAFTAEEDKTGSKVVMLSHDLWVSQFDSDANVLGRKIELDGEPYQVIGVMPKSFRYTQSTGTPEIGLWLPGVFQSAAASNRLGGQLRAIARLKPGVTQEQVRAELAAIAGRLSRTYPKEDKTIELGAVPLLETIVGDERSGLLLFLGAVGLVLLIACANVTNLLLARAGVRRREIAIRTAIGAGRPRLIRQLFTEGVLLSVAGGLAGVLLAAGSVKLLGLVLPDMYRLDEAGIDLRVLAFTLAVSLCSAVLFGLAPAIQISKADLNDVLRDSGRSISQSRASARLRGGFVVIQMALSLVLLAGAGLMINSFWRLHQIRLGFEPDHLLTVRCILPKSSRYVTGLGFKREGAGGSIALMSWGLTPEALQFPERVAERLERLPGVVSAAGSVCGLPLERTLGEGFAIEGRPSRNPADSERMRATRFAVTSGYFRTLGIRLLYGREFDDRDGPDAPRVVVINRALARLISPAEWNAIGQRVVWGDPAQSYQVVGVIDNIRLWPRQDYGPQLYFPQVQLRKEFYGGVGINLRLELYFVVRTRPDPQTATASVINAIHKEDPAQPVDEILTMDQVVAKSFGPWRSTMLLVGIFAIIAVLLAAVGTYGVISYAVTQRTHEIGVRMALGAGRGEVVALVMRRGLLLALAGVAIGISGAYGLTRLLASQLYGVKTTDPLTFTAVAAVLMGVALLSSYVPARRAARLDPASALRSE